MICLSIIGLTLNMVGSIFLAYSLNKTTKGLDNSITALEYFKDTYLAGGNVLSITGMDKHRKKDIKNFQMLTSIGLVLLIIGFALQLLPMLLNK